MAGYFANWVDLYRCNGDEEAYTYKCSNGREPKITVYGTTLIQFGNGGERPVELLTRTYYIPG